MQPMCLHPHPPRHPLPQTHRARVAHEVEVPEELVGLQALHAEQPSFVDEVDGEVQLVQRLATL